MTVFKATDGIVVGQPISPFFGAQNGIQGAGAPTIQSPAASPTSGPQITMLASVATGSLPRNLELGSVNGVSAGALNPTPIDDLMSNGAGNQVNLGTSTPNVSSNPTTNGAINQEQFVAGNVGAAMIQNGPTVIDTETLTSGPVSGATLTSNLTPYGTAGQPVFQG
jgi:hypothetical protein